MGDNEMSGILIHSDYWDNLPNVDMSIRSNQEEFIKKFAQIDSTQIQMRHLNRLNELWEDHIYNHFLVELILVYEKAHSNKSVKIDGQGIIQNMSPTNTLYKERMIIWQLLR